MSKCCRNDQNIKLDDSDKALSIEKNKKKNVVSQIYNNVWPLISIALGITIIVLLIIAIVRASKASDNEKYSSDSDTSSEENR